MRTTQLQQQPQIIIFANKRAQLNDRLIKRNIIFHNKKEKKAHTIERERELKWMQLFISAAEFWKAYPVHERASIFVGKFIEEKA